MLVVRGQKEVAIDASQDQITFNPTLGNILASIIGHPLFGCALLDCDGRIISGTPTFAEMIDCQVGQLFGQSIFDIFTFPNNLNSPHALVEGVPLRLVNRSETHSWQWSIHKLAAGNALAGYYIGLLWDESRLEGDELQLLYHDRLVSPVTLTAGVTHEIASPLSIIANNAELLLAEDKMDQEARETLAVMRDEAYRLCALLREFMAFVHNAPLNIKPQDAVQLVEKSVKLFNHQRNGKDITVRIEAEPDLPALAGDAERLQQLFFNLVKNAYDASPHGSEILIQIRRAATVQSDESIEFVIKDRGEGIAPSILDEIFKPFFSTKTAGQGTGLGLPIARRIVMAHHGDLRLNSLPGEGTQAIISLPARSNASCQREFKDEMF